MFLKKIHYLNFRVNGELCSPLDSENSLTMNKTIKKLMTEDEYYDMLAIKHIENRANALALIDKTDFEIKKIK